MKKLKITTQEAVFISLILLLGLVFIYYMYSNARRNNYTTALHLGKSIVAAMPVVNLSTFIGDSTDLKNPSYLELKNILQKVVKENTGVRFVYLFAQRKDQFVFLLDSEPPSSPDYSPPGQVFSEISEKDKMPFLDGKSMITPPLTDRWGTWVSVLIPIKERETGQVLAVFGMDIDAKSWKKSLLIEVIESTLLVIFLMLLGIFALRSSSKNKHLRSVIAQQQLIEKELTESEQRYRLLYENATIGIYRTTPEGQILLSNNALIKMLGYHSFEELKERNIEKGRFDPSYSRSEFKTRMERDGEIHGFENEWTLHNGEVIYIRENAKAVYDRNGKIEFYDGTIEDITGRKLAEKALAYSEERFRQIAEQSREVVWEVDVNGLYTYVSPLSLSILDYQPDDLVGKKHFYDLHPEETREYFKKATMEAFSRRESFQDYINQMVCGSGKTIWVMTNGVPIINSKGELVGYRGSDSDITERIEREHQLKKLTQAVEQSPVAIVITDINGAIEYGNPMACTSTGYTFNELAGKNPSILKSGYTAVSVYKDLWNTILSGKVWHGEFLNRRKNEDLYWESATIAPIFDNDGNIVNFVAVKEDISAIKKLISELKEAKDIAESSDLLKSAFIKNISHEIRTPLNGIVGMSEQILDTSLSENKKEQLVALIKESTSRLINTVNNYLDISLIVSGNMIVNLSKTDLLGVFAELKSEFQPISKEKNLELEFSAPVNEYKLSINADTEIYKKILSHLIDNALKFTLSGKVSFGYTINDEKVEIFVSDTGIGINKQFLPKIFDAFTQADATDTRSYEGSGLGLTIAYNLCLLIGAELQCETEENQGSRFSFTIPVIDTTLSKA